MIYVADHGWHGEMIVETNVCLAEETGEREARGTYIAHHGRARVNHLGAGLGACAKGGRWARWGKMGAPFGSTAREGGVAARDLALRCRAGGFIKAQGQKGNQRGCSHSAHAHAPAKASGARPPPWPLLLVLELRPAMLRRL